MTVVFFLLNILFAGSFFVWRKLIIRRSRRKPFLDLADGPRATWKSAGELAVIYVALLWTMLHLLPQMIGSPPAQPVSIDSKMVAWHAVINIGLTLALTTVLLSNQRQWSAVGLNGSNVRDQLRVGMGGFFASVIPMGISMVLAYPFRNRETQHSLLKLVLESPDFETVSLVALDAVVAAPLQEELLFRVIIQGWLTTFLRPTLAIGLVAVLFSMVHGWRDGIALLPLALILGYVFDRRHSYLAVVVIHSLFNATMLALELLSPQPSV